MRERILPVMRWSFVRRENEAELGYGLAIGQRPHLFPIPVAIPDERVDTPPMARFVACLRFFHQVVRSSCAGCHGQERR